MLRRCAPALAALLLGTAPALGAQYFGQNKVQYETFDFKIIQTQHFDVYFYERERPAATDVARMAERSYARLSKVLNHQFHERKPIIVYASHADFVQTNATPEEVGEGTGGFTDFLKHRNIFPLTGSYAENQHVLTHEMTHQFQYDIWSGGKAGGGIATLVAVNPPLWFVEGMAEYMSLGPVDANTAMWLRDASIEGKLPTINQLENDPRVFPYRFGHALLAYIGERWGDEAIGAVLQASRTSGIEGAFRRVLGVTLAQLSEQWRDAVLKKYLPEIGTRPKARAVATPMLTKERSEGTLHLAPALSPDGTKVAYFSEKDFFFVDLYLADVATGKVDRRLLKSTYSSNYETFRFINSQASWSPDGRFLATAGKRGPRDEIIIIDVKRDRQVGRIRVDLNGVTTPSWSPDGKQLVFTGYDGGISDLFVVDADGRNLRRLTSDKYADLDPVWSPDGKSIAFATDRGPKTDFALLDFGNLRIATYDLDTGAIRVLPHMDDGNNVSVQWAPDGKSLAFVSDRTGVSNIFLYDLGSDEVYQISDFYTGVQGITPISPVLSWAHAADRLAFVYYEDGKYDVYSFDNPRSRRRQPYQPVPRDSATAVASISARPAPTAEPAPTAPAAQPSTPQVGEGGSIYRTPRGFRSASELAAAGDSSRVPAPVSVVALLDSANFALPDTSEFTHKPYTTHFTPDYVARPSIGYQRDNFGNGFFGGSAIQLSDMLGNQQLIFAGYVNGRLLESQVLAAYTNLAHRTNYTLGVQQQPYFFFEAYEDRVGTSPTENTFVTHIRRIIVRSAFAMASHPFSRFQRVEASMAYANVSDADLEIQEPYDNATGIATQDPILVTNGRPGINYVQPSLALVFDNTLFGYVGPFYGRRYRFEVAQSLGDWRYTQLTADYRRYDKLVGPFSLATRALFFGRTGRDAGQFPIFGGNTELIRGQTSGSYQRNECASQPVTGSITGCSNLDRLVGTQIGLASAEIRFPLINARLGVVPSGFPPVEGALFYDVGVVRDVGTKLVWSYAPGQENDPTFRAPLQTVGASLRINVLGFVILRVDYSRPLRRPGVGGLWAVSFGPTF